MRCWDKKRLVDRLAPRWLHGLCQFNCFNVPEDQYNVINGLICFRATPADHLNSPPISFRELNKNMHSNKSSIIRLSILRRPPNPLVHPLFLEGLYVVSSLLQIRIEGHYYSWSEFESLKKNRGSPKPLLGLLLDCQNSGPLHFRGAGAVAHLALGHRRAYKQVDYFSYDTYFLLLF